MKPNYWKFSDKWIHNCAKVTFYQKISSHRSSRFSSPINNKWYEAEITKFKS